MSQCKAITRTGEQCRRQARPNKDYCWQHAYRAGVREILRDPVWQGIGALVSLIGLLVTLYFSMVNPLFFAPPRTSATAEREAKVTDRPTAEGTTAHVIPPTPPGSSPSISAANQNIRLAAPIINISECETVLYIENRGVTSTKAALVLWGPSAACEPQASGPVRVACTGVIAPGATWTLQIDKPAGAESGIVYSVGNAPDADKLCKDWRERALGDWWGWLELDRQYITGSLSVADENVNGHRDIEDIYDVSLQPLAVTIKRKCSGISATYRAISEAVASSSRQGTDEYEYEVPLGSKMTLNSKKVLVHVQNFGQQCTSVEFRVQQQDTGSWMKIEEVFALPAGEGISLDFSERIRSLRSDSLFADSSQPLGLVVDLVDTDTDTFVTWSVPATD